MNFFHGLFLNHISDDKKTNNKRCKQNKISDKSWCHKRIFSKIIKSAEYLNSCGVEYYKSCVKVIRKIKI